MEFWDDNQRKLYRTARRSRIWLNVGYMANRSNNWTITIAMYSFFRGEAESGLRLEFWNLRKFRGSCCGNSQRRPQIEVWKRSFEFIRIIRFLVWFFRFLVWFFAGVHQKQLFCNSSGPLKLLAIVERRPGSLPGSKHLRVGTALRP